MIEQVLKNYVGRDKSDQASHSNLKVYYSKKIIIKWERIHEENSAHKVLMCKNHCAMILEV